MKPIAGVLTPSQMSKRQRGRLLIKEVSIPEYLQRELHMNDTRLKKTFNKLASHMVKGRVDFNTDFLKKLLDKIAMERLNVRHKLDKIAMERLNVRHNENGIPELMD